MSSKLDWYEKIRNKPNVRHGFFYSYYRGEFRKYEGYADGRYFASLDMPDRGVRDIAPEPGQVLGFAVWLEEDDPKRAIWALMRKHSKQRDKARKEAEKHDLAIQELYRLQDQY